jgi:peptidoglycan/xylan/chitin deacetylase (PgdA/CDA1 family)
MQRAREELSAGLGYEVRFLAYPYGTSSPAVIRLARLAGYEAMFSALGGHVSGGSGLDAIPRITIRNSFDMPRFAAIVAGRDPQSGGDASLAPHPADAYPPEGGEGDDE